MPREIHYKLRCVELSPTSFRHISPSWYRPSERIKSQKFLSTLLVSRLDYPASLIDNKVGLGIAVIPELKNAGITSTDIRNAHDLTAGGAMVYSCCGIFAVGTSITATLSNLKKINGKYRKLVSNFLANPELLELAYDNIKNQPSSPIFGLSSEWFHKLSEALRGGIYKFSNPRRVVVLKPLGGHRLLSITNIGDRIILEAVRIILESIYVDKLKLFRPSGSPHVALKEIKHYWSAIPWYVELKVNPIFSARCQHKLMSILRVHISDRGLESLLHKMFKLKILTGGTLLTFSKFGVPADNSLCSLLGDLYFSELDRFVGNIIAQYSTGLCSIKNSDYISYIALTEKEKSELTLENQLAVRSRKRRESFICGSSPALINNLFIRIKYVRCSGDFIIGVRGSKELVQKIKKSVCCFIESSLHLSIVGTKLIHSYYNKVKFLGMCIQNTRPENLPYRNSRERESQKRKKVAILNRISTYKSSRYKDLRVRIHSYLKKKMLKYNGQTSNNILTLLKDSDLLSNGSLNQRGMVRGLIDKITAVCFSVEDVKLKSILIQLEDLVPKNFINTRRVSHLKNPARIDIFHYIYEKFKNSGFDLGAKPPTTKQIENYMRGVVTSIFFLPEQLELSPSVMEVMRLNSRFPVKSRINENYKVVLGLLLSYQNSKYVDSIASRDSTQETKSRYLYKMRISLPPQIYGDTGDLYAKLLRVGMVNIKKMPQSKNNLLVVDDYNIILYFKSVALGLLYYYRCSDNLSKIKRIINYHIRFSLIRTLKNKHKLTTSKVNQIYGNPVTCSKARGHCISFLSYSELFNYKKKFLIDRVVGSYEVL